MRLKSILIITLLLTVIAVVLVLMEQRTESVDPTHRYPRPLIADPQVFEEANRLVLRDATTDSKPLVMVRDGRRWQLEDYHGIPVQRAAMQRLSRKLGEARLIRFVTESPERIQLLKIGKQEMRVMDGDRELVRIQLGQSASREGQPVSLDGERVHLLSESLRWSIDPADWWESRVLHPLGEQHIKGFTLQWPDGSSLRAERDSDHDLFAVSEGEAKDHFDTARARRLLRSLLSARIEGSHDQDAEVVRVASDTAFIFKLETFFDSTAEIRLMRSPAREELAPPGENDSPAEAREELADLFRTATPQAEEQEPRSKRVPPGPVIAIYQGDALEPEWQTPAEKAAFVLRDSAWDHLPQSVEAFFVSEE